MRNEIWRWIIGLIYIFAVAAIWIAASYVVQSVVDAGISPFFITYICNSLFMIYIPLVEIAWFLEGYTGKLRFRRDKSNVTLPKSGNSEEIVLLETKELVELSPHGYDKQEGQLHFGESEIGPTVGLHEVEERNLLLRTGVDEIPNKQLDVKGRWTRSRVAKVSLLICPFWFLAQLAFNLSLKYTTVTSNTILSTSSGLFTFLLSLAFLGEKFTWLKLIGVLLCMGGTIIVSLGDSAEAGLSVINSTPVLGDILSLTSAGLYAVYITLIRKKLPDDKKSGQVSMAQFLGYLGFFNMVIFLPVALLLHVTKLESYIILNWKQLGLIVGKGLLDNVLSDYLWAKAVLLTTTTVATAGLTIQVPLAAVVDTLLGNAPSMTDYIGAVAILIGFVAINIPLDGSSLTSKATIELQNGITDNQSHINILPDSKDASENL